MKKYYIYAIKNKTNGKMYIGSTENSKQRKSTHLRKIKANKHGSKSIREDALIYGYESFEYIELESGLYDFNYADLLIKEEFWVLKFDTINPEKGYNKELPTNENDSKREGYKNYLLTKGPKNLKKISLEDYIEKKTENPDFVVTLPKGTGNALKKKLVEIDIQSNKFVREYESILEAININKFSDASFRINVAHNSKPSTYHRRNRKSFFVLKDVYAEGLKFIPKKKEKVIKEPKVLPILEIININTKEVKSFNFMTEIAAFLKCSKTKVIRLKNGWENKGGGRIVKVHQIKGWKFKTVFE